MNATRGVSLPHGVDWDLGVDVPLQFGGVHVGDVLEVRREAMVLANQRIEDGSEVDVGVLVTGVDAAVLIVELDGAGAGLQVVEIKAHFIFYNNYGAF